MRTFTFIALALSLVVSGAVDGQSKRPFTPLDLVTFDRPSGFSPSIKGTNLLYFNSKYNAETNKKTNTVHLLNTVTGEEKDITALTTNDFSDPQWISDTKVVFVSSRSKSPQLWSYDFANQGAAPVQLTNLTVTEINGPKYNPVTKQLVFSAGVPLKTENKPANSFSSALVYDQLYVRHWDTWNDYINQHVHVTQIEDGKLATEAKDLLIENPNFESPRRPDYDPSEYAQSNDGKYVAFLTRPDSRDVAWKTTTELYLVPTQGEPKLKLISDKGFGAIGNVLFSPDDKILAYFLIKSPINESGKNVIIFHHLATGKKQELIADWDVNPSSFTFSNDGKSLYLSVVDKGQNKIYQLDLKTNQKKEIVKNGSNSLIAEYDDKLFLTRARATHPTEVYSVKKDGSQLKPVTKVNTEALKQFQLNPLEEFYFTGAKNEKVQGLLIKPYNFDPSKKYPVLFWIHGGPESAFNDNWSNRWNYQIGPNAGYVLVTINFHGSPGFGQQFTESILKNWGSYPYEDLMKGLNYALKNFCYLDGNRVAAWGASYGGYMVNYINGHTNRFKALVVHDGVFDSRHSYYTTEELYFMESEFGGAPFDNPEYYNKYSPSTYVKNWKTPTLVIHGGKDYRLVDGEGLAAFTALQRQGIPSKFVYFPEENHWVLKNANSLRWHKENLAWTAKWLNHTMPYQL